MPVDLFLYRKSDLSILLRGNFVQTVDGEKLLADSLHLPGNEKFDIPNGLSVRRELIEEIAAGEFRFKAGQAAATLTAQLTPAPTTTTFFGKQINLEIAFSARITIQVPLQGQAATLPFLTLDLCAAIKLDAEQGDTSASFSTEPFCLRVTLDRLPEFPSIELPALHLKLPDFGLRLPHLRLPWQFPNFPGFPFHLPAFSLPHVALPLTVSWKGIRPRLTKDQIVIDIDHLKIAGKINAVEADVHLVIKNGKVVPLESYIHFYRPDIGNLRRVLIKNWHFDNECLVLQWEDDELNAWLKLLSPDLADKQLVSGATLTLRLLWSGNQLDEFRLDWQSPGQQRSLALPGFEVSIPPVELYTFAVWRDASDAHHATFITTFDEKAELAAHSTFTLTRGTQRELHQDNNRPNDLINFKASPSKDLSVVLMDLPFGGKSAITFFKQLDVALKPFDFNKAESLCESMSYKPIRLRVADWDKPQLAVNTDEIKKFLLPILKKGDEKAPSPTEQFITIGAPHPKLPAADTTPGNEGFFKPVIGCDLDVEVKIGSIKLATTITLEFDWERFAFSVSDDAGIRFFRKEPVKQNFLGLEWTFTPSSKLNEKGEGELFVLATKDGNFQLKQAEGAKLTVAFTKATSPEHPIIFQVTDFILASSGISLTARVTDSPARLNGLETQARFLDGTLQIHDNQITDFTITGQCPLPPALVGNGTAQISLQFGQRDGHLELLAGIAELKGSKELKCPSTRFQYSIEGMKLKFVNDGRYHLYFTLTGQARFVPFPSDDKSGPLAWLSTLTLQLIDAPLTGDAREIAKHIKLLVELPQKATFDFLGCFKMELRGIAFHPHTDKFGDDTAAIELSGQVKFAQGGGDVIDARIDFHSLFIGLPAPGEFLPRIYLKHLGFKIKSGEAFELEGEVDFFNSGDEIEPGIQARGFAGSGTLTIQGLPQMSATFAFLRVSNNGGLRWVKAWFVYVEVRKLSLRIPVVNVFLREVGLGFGYRYTLASVKTADELDDPKRLIKELQKLSLTQGELSRRDQWRVDIEPEGEDPRWTIALRALIAQASAAAGPIDWNTAREKDLSCAFLMDAVLALRSDLTFLMTVRGWMNTNYNDFLEDKKGLRTKPLLSGFVLLSPRKKRLLAHFASNPGAEFGDHPPLPSLVKDAIRGSRFSATLLIEPSLFHLEMGWPNQLRWGGKLGPLTAEFRGGAIFRVSDRELVVGQSYMARGSLELSAEVNLGVVGARLSATATVAYGARYIGVIGFVKPAETSALYGAVGVEINVQCSVEFWIKIKLFFAKITLRFRFSFSISLTAFLEVGVTASDLIGLRGTATVGLRIMGRSLHFNVHVGINEGAVTKAFGITEKFLKIGLEAEEVEPVPGSSAAQVNSAPSQGFAPSPQENAIDLTNANGVFLAAAAEAAAVAVAAAEQQPSPADVFETPEYSIYSIPTRDKDGREVTYFVFLPAGERQDGAQETHFLPVPPQELFVPGNDFEWTLPANNGAAKIKKFDFENKKWPDAPISSASLKWAVKWDAPLGEGLAKNLKEGQKADFNDASEFNVSVRAFLRHAYITFRPEPEPVDSDPGKQAALRLANVIPVKDPDAMPGADRVIEDPRVHNPSENSIEAAVRGAQQQFEGSPYLKRDTRSLYEESLKRAFDNQTTLYAASGAMPSNNDEKTLLQQQAYQLRGVVVRQLMTDLQQYAALSSLPNPTQQQKQELDGLIASSPAFLMGLVFRVDDDTPGWLKDGGNAGTMRQRIKRDSTEPDSTAPAQPNIHAFNTGQTRFDNRPPQFQRVRHYADANTIAITWDLIWPVEWTKDLKGSQKEPEQHLQHYLVRRRALAGGEREVEFTLKNVEVLNRTKDNGKEILERLRPRFQLVDHFNEETADDLAQLPPNGKTYLYTITPIDVAGIPSARPLTVVATRRANEPPQVPLDGELIVKYRLRDGIFETLAMVSADAAQKVVPVETPQSILVQWTPPPDPERGPIVAVATYRLVFRKETTFPVGSYGQDSDSQGSRASGLPTSNARPLRTDIFINLTAEDHDTDPAKLRAKIKIEELRAAGVFPKDGAAWQPESWRIFFQTISDRDVPSALTPVQLSLQFRTLETEQENKTEERRPGQLEWLASPVRFAPLPPEDERATAGPAQVVMPVLDEAQGLNLTFKLGDSSSELDPAFGYQAHPEGLRAVRFDWNQGPSASGNYPVDLHAGYELYEFDLDAYTAEVLDNQETEDDQENLLNRMRRIQQLQILSAENLRLTPADNLTANQWEAWYPSTVRRRQLREKNQTSAPPQRSEASLSPWYSWRDSYLEWPDEQGFFDPPPPDEPPSHLHPFLKKLIAELGKTPDGSPTITVDVNPPPPDKPGTLRSLLTATAPNLDPYGWNILKRMGLTFTFVLRDGKTGEPLDSETTLARLRTALGLLPQNDPMFRHLHIEHLFQPAQSTRLPGEDKTISASTLLAAIQISLRPAIKQVFGYVKFLIVDDGSGEGGKVTASINIGGTPCRLIEQTEHTVGAPETISANTDRTMLLPPTGRTVLIFQSISPAQIKVTAKGGTVTSEFIPPTDWLANYFDQPGDAWPEKLAGASTLAKNVSDNWARFEKYLLHINPPGTGEPNDPKIELPKKEKVGNPAIEVLPADARGELLVWLSRFFDASGDVLPVAADQLGATGNGPWIASAYQRAVSPVGVTPNTAGQLRYYHPVEDKWAHLYRYYVLPHGRYDLLWQNLAQSSRLFPDVQNEENPRVKNLRALRRFDAPEHGGLDVVLDRIKSMVPPLVLFSGRLDLKLSDAAPTPPGKTWEVIIAKHPEQSLIERNRTLQRQLSYRQMAHTLLRRFAFATDLQQFREVMRKQQFEFSLLFVENQTRQPLPGTYPAPEHLDFDKTTPDEVRTLDLPERLNSFDQAAVILQWEALPYFYEHRLLLVAQSSAVVSPITDVIQRDFEYVSPQPESALEGVADAGDKRSLLATIRLNNFWECLPESAQQRWQIEEPSNTGAERKLSSLPDTAVNYQVIYERDGGVIEAQAEFSFDPAQPSGYKARQISDKFTATPSQILPPNADADEQQPFRLAAHLTKKAEIRLKSLAAPILVQGDFTRVDRDNLLKQFIGQLPRFGADFRTPESTHRTINRWWAARSVSQRASLPEALLSKVEYYRQGSFLWLVCHEMLEESERAQLLAAFGQDAASVAQVRKLFDDLDDRQTLDRFLKDWVSEQAISTGSAFPELAQWHDRLELIAPEACVLVLNGVLSPNEVEELERLSRTTDVSFATAARQLIDRMNPEKPVIAEASVGLEQIRELSLLAVAPTEANKKLTWRGVISLDQQRALKLWSRTSMYGQTFSDLLSAINTRTLIQPFEKDEQLPQHDLNELRDDLNGRLGVDPTAGTISWRGLLINREEIGILAEFNSRPSLGTTLRRAFQSLLNELTNQTISAQSEVSVDVPETWLPRPGPENLSETLRAKLLIGNGRIRFYGWMTRNEAESLRTGRAEPDRQAVARLFEDSMNAGLDGGHLQIQSRRGSADVNSVAMNAKL